MNNLVTSIFYTFLLARALCPREASFPHLLPKATISSHTSKREKCQGNENWHHGKEKVSHSHSGRERSSPVLHSTVLSKPSCSWVCPSAGLHNTICILNSSHRTQFEIHNKFNGKTGESSFYIQSPKHSWPWKVYYASEISIAYLNKLTLELSSI